MDTVQQFLADDRVDLVFHGLTWTAAREHRWPVSFTVVSFHDGQAVAVHRVPPANAASRGIVCVQGGSVFEERLLSAGPYRRLLALDDTEAAKRAFLAGRCEGWSWDASSLMSALAGPDAARYRLLPERYSREALAPIVRADDRNLLGAVRWTIDTVIEAEDHGFTQQQALGKHGLAARVVAAIGNYGEIYRRNLEGPLRIMAARGPNLLARDGGLLSVTAGPEP